MRSLWNAVSFYVNMGIILMISLVDEFWSSVKNSSRSVLLSLISERSCWWTIRKLVMICLSSLDNSGSAFIFSGLAGTVLDEEELAIDSRRRVRFIGVVGVIGSGFSAESSDKLVGSGLS